MNNNVVIALFMLLVLIIFFSSLQTSSQTNKTVTNANTVLQQTTGIPSPQLSVTTTQIVTPTAKPTQIPTLFPTPTVIPIQHPGYRVNVGEGSDD